MRRYSSDSRKFLHAEIDKSIIFDIILCRLKKEKSETEKQYDKTQKKDCDRDTLGRIYYVYGNVSDGNYGVRAGARDGIPHG